MTRKLLFLNGLAILAIPIQHVTAYGLQAMFEWTDRYRDVLVPNYDAVGSPAFVVSMVLRQLSTYSVPGFLFISGFFIAFMVRGKEANLSYKTILPRIRTLVYPFLIWTVIRYILLRQFPSSLDDILNPYHFIPLLIQFYLISPLLVKWARRNWKSLLAITAVLHLGLQLVRYIEDFGLTFPGMEQILFVSPRWAIHGQQPFWFPLGLVAGMNTKGFGDFLERVKPWLLPAAILFAVTLNAEYLIADSLNGPAWIGPTFSGFSRNFFILAVLMLVLASDDTKFPYSKKISEVGTRSLGIYLGNIPFIYVTAVLMYRLTPALLGIQVLYQPILFAAGFLGPLALMWFVRSTRLRGAYRYLFG